MATTYGSITRLVRDKGFGFIKGEASTEEYFFHRSGAIDPYETLTEGQRVRFEPARGPKGLRAEHVELA